MSAKLGNRPKFETGDRVRVKGGVTDPVLPEVIISGWRGVVSERQAATARRPARCLVAWNRSTLEVLSPDYRAMRERQGCDVEQMWLNEDDLELDNSREFLADWKKLGRSFLSD